MKKVLFVIDSLGCGGAEKSLVSLLPLLNREKYKIHLWILKRGGVFESLLPDNVIIQSEPKYSLFEKIKLHIAQSLFSLALRRNAFLQKNEHGAETYWKCVGWAFKVPEENYDVAIAYQQGFPTYLVATKIQAKRKIAWINVNIYNAGYDSSFNYAFYDKFNILVPVSEDLNTILKKGYPQFVDRFFCVYDILNPTLIIEQSLELINESNIINNNLLLVTTGRLEVQKNHELAVKAAKLLRDRGIDYKWLFIGEGSERSKIENLINEYELQYNVILLGMKTNPYPYMARCDVYVQTSSFEGFGLTIAEAKILGKPVVSTNFDVVHDQLKHGENGLIAEMTPESVSGNIIRLLEDDDLRNHIVANVKKEENTTYISEVEKVEGLLDAD